MLSFHHHVAVTFLLTAGTFRMSCHATFKEPERLLPDETRQAPEMCAVGGDAEAQNGGDEKGSLPCPTSAERA